ncbi:MAG: hypothetical protein ABI655_13395 [Phenylobacterium sp.]
MSQLAIQGQPTDEALKRAKLFSLGQALREEGRLDGAITIFEHLLSFNATHKVVLLALVKALGAKGETLRALQLLQAVRDQQLDPSQLLADIQEQVGPAAERFNACLGAGRLEEATALADALAGLVPQGEPLLVAALSCNQALGRTAAVERYAKALLAINPQHAVAQAALGGQAPPVSEDDPELEARVAAVLSPASDVHPLLQLRDLHDTASAILCQPLTAASEAKLERLLAAARALTIHGEPGSEWEAWEKHYRLLMEAIDLAAVRGPTPEPLADPAPAFVTGAGAPLDWTGVKAKAQRSGAAVVFFAAADAAYVELYARWYALSVLKYCDRRCLVVVHVIGGAGRLAEIAAQVGIADERLIFAGDNFDKEAPVARNYDAPPKGLIAAPVAYYQSVRFLRLGALLEKLALPVFVSDIDLLLQRGVDDLLQRCAGADVAFNENTASPSAGSRLTANLLLVRPTANAQVLLRFLHSYLSGRLARPEVTRWIDQVALLLARHHLTRRGADPQIAYFDTTSDINNVMYTSYQAHPFRFLSLYHGFDTSSLEGDVRVLGEAEPAAA